MRTKRWSLPICFVVLVLMISGLACGRRGSETPTDDGATAVVVVVTATTAEGQPASGAPVVEESPAAPAAGEGAPAGQSDAGPAPADQPDSEPPPADQSGSEPPPAEASDSEPLVVPGQPVIDYFRAEPSENEGCFYLHWDLHDATAAYLDGEGVVSPGSVEVCPEATTTYTLRAENEAGSVEAAVTVESSPPADDQEPPLAVPPANLAARVEGNSLVITWLDGEGEAGYYVETGGAPGGQLEANETSYTWSDPPCGTNVAIMVMAFDAGGAEIGRLQIAADTPPCLDSPTFSPPSNLQANVQDGDLVVTWDDGEGEGSYVIQSVGLLDGRLDADSASYTWTNPPCGTAMVVNLIALAPDGSEIGRVQTSVETPPCAEALQTVTLQSLPAEDGHVRGRDSGQGATLGGNVALGDSDQDWGFQAFFSFDLSGIPQGATIQAVGLDLSNHRIQGRPFASLGPWRAYVVDYGSLGAEDFNTDWDAAHSFLTASTPPGISHPLDRVQHWVDSGVGRFRIRLQFQTATNNNGETDAVIFPDGGPALTVTYAP